MKTYDNENALETIFEARLGKINEVYKESKTNSDDKRLFCNITIFPAGEKKNVPIYGGGIDYDTKFPHGLFIPPREKQMVLVFFIRGYLENPVAAIPLPYNIDSSDESIKMFYDIIESIDDIGMYHFSGTRMIMREDGEVEFQKRIEESTDTFVNHTLRLEFKYEDNLRKKIITDVDNSFTTTITGEDVSFVDTKSQGLYFHSKDNEEYTKWIDHAGQYIQMDSTSDSEYIKLVDKASQIIKLDSSSGTENIEIKDKAGQYLKLDATSGSENIKLNNKNNTYVELTNTVLNLNGNTKSFVTYAELNTALQAMVTSINSKFLTSADNGVTGGGLTLNISSSESQKVKTG